MITDWQFASGCSPPRLSTNAVTFGYGRPVCRQEGTFTLLLVRALRRTILRLWRTQKRPNSRIPNGVWERSSAGCPSAHRIRHCNQKPEGECAPQNRAGPGRASPHGLAPPQSRTSPIKAYGSSSYDFAAYIEWTTLAGGNGKRLSRSENRTQGSSLLRFLRWSHLCQRRLTASRNRSSALLLPVIP